MTSSGNAANRDGRGLAVLSPLADACRAGVPGLATAWAVALDAVDDGPDTDDNDDDDDDDDIDRASLSSSSRDANCRRRISSFCLLAAADASALAWIELNK